MSDSDERGKICNCRNYFPGLNSIEIEVPLKFSTDSRVSGRKGICYREKFAEQFYTVVSLKLYDFNPSMT